MSFNELKSNEIIQKTIEALKANNINAILANSASEAKSRALELIPNGSEVMTMTSVTLDTIGLTEELNDTGNYDSVRNKLYALNRDTDSLQMQKLGAAPEYVVGSVHAVTEDGQVVIASLTGSQLPAYAYGSAHVIWVVGVQKIVKNLDEAMKRIYDYTLELESDRARKAYGVPGSAINKLLVFNKEINPQRIHLIFVNEVLGY